MIKVYIQDSTIGQYKTFDTVPQLVKYISEQIVPRAFKMSRAQFVQNLIDLGHGYDDNDGVMLTRAIAEQFNIGVVREGKYIRTDVHEVSRFQNENYGN